MSEDMVAPLRIYPKLLRLKETHPTAVKLDKLWEFMDKLGISISVVHQTTVVNDKDRDQKLPPIYMSDLEDGDACIDDFPPSFEYRLHYENPDYLESEREKSAAREEQLSAERARAREAKQRLEEERAEKQARELEKHERAMLANLKAKYE